MKSEDAARVPLAVLNILSEWDMEISGDDNAPVVFRARGDLRNTCLNLKDLYEVNDEAANRTRGRASREYRKWANDTLAWARRLGCAWAQRC